MFCKILYLLLSFYLLVFLHEHQSKNPPKCADDMEYFLYRTGRSFNIIFRRKKLFQKEDAYEARKRCEKVDRKLNGLINSLKGKHRKISSNLGP